MGRTQTNTTDYKCDYPCSPACESTARTTQGLAPGWSVNYTDEEVAIEPELEGGAKTKLVRRIHYYCPDHTP